MVNFEGSFEEELRRPVTSAHFVERLGQLSLTGTSIFSEAETATQQSAPSAIDGSAPTQEL